MAAADNWNQGGDSRDMILGELRADVRYLREGLARLENRIDRLMWGIIAATVVLGGGILGTLITVLLSVD